MLSKIFLRQRKVTKKKKLNLKKTKIKWTGMFELLFIIVKVFAKKNLLGQKFSNLTEKNSKKTKQTNIIIKTKKLSVECLN